MRFILSVALLAVLISAGCQSTKSGSIPAHSFAHSAHEYIPSPSEAAPVSNQRSPIEDFVSIGLANNPRIAEAELRIEALQHRIPQALSLPDPMVTTTTHLAPIETAAGRQQFALGFNQKFVNRNRRAATASVIHHELDAAHAELEALKIEIADDIRHACWQLVLIRKSIEIATEDQQSLARIAEIVDEQFRVKREVSQQDALNIQIEQSNVENQLSSLTQQEKTWSSQLARLLNQNPQSDFEIIDELEIETDSFNLEELIAQALQLRPELRAQLARIRGNQSKVHLAELEHCPDFTMGLNWIATSSSGISPVANGDDALLLGINFNLPIYKNRIRAKVCEAHANRMASETRILSLQNEIAQQILELVAKLENTRDTLLLFQDDIIPKSERSFELAQIEYSTGKIDFGQLISDWRSVLRYRLAEAKLQAQYHQQISALSSSVGMLDPIDFAPATVIAAPDQVSD